LKNLCGFSTAWADLADLGCTKIAEQWLKYATFEAIFFLYFHGQKRFFFKNLKNTLGSALKNYMI
jgi:hypothetical protein